MTLPLYLIRYHLDQVVYYSESERKEEAKKRLEKRLEKRENTYIENLTEGTNLKL